MCDILAEALAFVIRNRAAQGRAHTRATGRAHPEFGDGTLRAAALHLLPSLTGTALARAAARCLRRGMPAHAADPTAGALYLHRHGECPAWARGLAATALIGPYLFLAPPSTKSIETERSVPCSQTSRPSPLTASARSFPPRRPGSRR